MGEDFNMDSFTEFNDSPIFGINDGDEFIDSERILSTEEAESYANSFLNNEEQADELDNKNDNTVEDEDDPDEVGSEEDVDEGGNDDDKSDSSSNLYSSLASVIHEQGLLPSVNIEKLDINNVDDFAKVLRDEQEVQAKLLLEQYIANLDVEKIKQPISDLKNLETVDSDYLANNLEYAKNLIRQDYTNQGLDESKINRIINRLVDLGEEDLIDESLKAKDSLIEQNKEVVEAEKQRQFKERAEIEKQNAKAQEEIKKRVFDSDIVEGFKPTRTFREKMYNTMTTIVGEDPNGNPENAFMKSRREDIVGFETRMYAFYELTNGFTDFSKLATTSKSKAVQELEKAARGKIIQNNSTPTYVNDKDSYYGSGDFILNI